MLLHGRDSELREIADALLERCSVVLRGDAGIGKTALWRAALGAIGERGAKVERVVATATTRLIPGGALAALVARFDAAVAPDDRLVATLRVLAAGGERFVIGVDDAHLLDDESAAAVLQHALGGGTVLVTVRQHEPAPDAVVRLWKDGLARVLDLGSLSAAAAAGLVEELVAAPVDALTQARLHEASGGSPLVLRELVAHGHASRALVDLGGVWSWTGELAPSPSVAAVIRERLARIDPAARAIAELLAVGGPLPAALLEPLATTSARNAARRAGVIRERPHAERAVVELAHPLYAPVLTDGLAAERTHALLGKLVETAAPLAARDPELEVLLAAWLVRLADGSRPALFVATAERAFSRADLALAERLARAAVAAGGGEPAERVAARIATFLGGSEPRDARDERDDETRFQAAVGRADAFFVGFAPRDTALAALAAAQPSLCPARREELAVLALAIRLHAGDPAPEVLRDTLPLFERGVSPAVVARAALVIGPALTVAGRPLDAIDALDRGVVAGERAHGFSPYLLDRLHSTRVQNLLFAGRLEAARAAASERYACAESAGDEPALATWSQILAQILLWRGRPREAARYIGEVIALTHGVDLVGNAAWCQSDLAACRAWAEDAGGDVLPAVPAPGSHGALLAPFVHVALATRHLCTGQHADAEREAGAAIERAAGSGQILSELLAQHLVLRLRPTRWRAGRVAELAADCQGELAAALAQSAGALAQRSAAGLERAAQRFAGSGFTALATEWFLRAALAYGDDAAPLAARRCGNAAAAQRSHMEADPPLPAQAAAVDPLTPREHEVAALATRGLTNHAIADRLGVSVRTVHAHLRTVYAKLGVNDRQHLAVVLQRWLAPRRDDQGSSP